MQQAQPMPVALSGPFGMVYIFYYYYYYCSNTTIYATSLPPHRHTSSHSATAHRHITQQRQQTTISGNDTMRADPDNANYIVWAVGSVFFFVHYIITN